MHAVIKGIGSYVPSKRVSNDDLAKLVDTSDEWIYSHTGIKNRHIAAENEATSDLAVQAAQRALEKAGCPASMVDLILVATATPDYLGFPSTACIVQDRIGAENAGAMDIVAACTGFIYGIETARVFIETGTYKHVLVIGAETLSKITDWKDRNTCVLFGDGAGAALLTACEEVSPKRGVLTSYLASYGKDAEVLLRPVGGTRVPFVPGTTPPEDMFLRMNGRKVYTFAVSVLGKTIETLLKKTGLSLQDIRYIVPHQANVRIIEACAKRLDIPLEKFFLNIEEFANTSAASIPIALTDMERQGLLHPGDLILTVGFGGGLTYGGNILYW
ncbi:MAG: ketoacyl-ACP synthase III [Spirochaetes bacterium]|nr:ketoacyl-ACP synthase III [Spirochaetota bacterium]